MFVDGITIKAKAGSGGNGVVRWRQEKFRPMGGPAGGNGGHGGDVFVRAIRNLNQLAKYTGSKEFYAKNGENGRALSQFGKGSNDLYIDVPVGSVVKDVERDRIYEMMTEGQTERILKGGVGGLGNENFKSSTNRSPVQATEGGKGEEGTFTIELSLVVDVGFIGLPNAGKSSLLNALTNSKSAIGDYEFTTLQPHLGDFYGYTLVDIPGLIEGAAQGKGLGHRFLRHVEKTKMLLHLVSLEHVEPLKMYEMVRKELSVYKKELSDKEEWIIFTKKDLVSSPIIESLKEDLDKNENRVFFMSLLDANDVKKLSDELIKKLRGEVEN